MGFLMVLQFRVSEGFNMSRNSSLLELPQWSLLHYILDQIRAPFSGCSPFTVCCEISTRSRLRIPLLNNTYV